MHWPCRWHQAILQARQHYVPLKLIITFRWPSSWNDAVRLIISISLTISRLSFRMASLAQLILATDDHDISSFVLLFNFVPTSQTEVGWRETWSTTKEICFILHTWGAAFRKFQLRFAWPGVCEWNQWLNNYWEKPINRFPHFSACWNIHHSTPSHINQGSLRTPLSWTLCYLENPEACLERMSLSSYVKPSPIRRTFCSYGNLRKETNDFHKWLNNPA